MRTLRLTVPLDERENDALVAMSRQEYRSPKMQIRHLLREEAIRRGLIPASEAQREQRSDGLIYMPGVPNANT